VWVVVGLAVSRNSLHSRAQWLIDRATKAASLYVRKEKRQKEGVLV